MSHARVGGDGAGVPWRNRTVQVVLASTLVAPLGVPLVAPALPVVRDAFGLTDPQASLLVSAYFLVGILVSPFVGLLADRVGRRRVLVPALAVFGVTGLAGFLAPDYLTLLALRALQGTAAAALFVTTVTIIGDAFEGSRRNAVLGANVAALSVGAAVFPVLGGALAAVAWNAPFLAYGIALPVALFALVGLEDGDDEGGNGQEHPPRERSAAGGDSHGGLGYLRGVVGALTPAMAGLLATAFLTEFLLFGALVTGLPFLLTASFGLAPLYVGLVITAAEAGSVLAASASGRLARVLTNGRLIGLGFACYGLGLAGIYVAPAPVAVALAVAVFGAGLGVSMPAVDAAVSERVDREHRAGLLGLRNSTTFLGRATGPVAFAAAATLSGYRPLMASAAVAVLALAVAVTVLSRGRAADIEAEPAD